MFKHLQSVQDLIFGWNLKNHIFTCWKFLYTDTRCILYTDIYRYFYLLDVLYETESAKSLVAARRNLFCISLSLIWFKLVLNLFQAAVFSLIKFKSKSFLQRIYQIYWHWFSPASLHGTRHSRGTAKKERCSLNKFIFKLFK